MRLLFLALLFALWLGLVWLAYAALRPSRRRKGGAARVIVGDLEVELTAGPGETKIYEAPGVRIVVSDGSRVEGLRVGARARPKGGP
jgi:hypothetical protein